MSERSVCYHQRLIPRWSLNQLCYHSKLAQLWLQKSSRPHRRKMHCLEQLNGQALFLTQRRCLSLNLCEKQCHRIYAIVEQPSRSIDLGALFFSFFVGGTSLTKSLTCAIFVWQYKQLDVLPIPSPARKGAASNHKEQIIYSSHFETSIGKIFLHLKRHH